MNDDVVEMMMRRGRKQNEYARDSSWRWENEQRRRRGAGAVVFDEPCVAALLCVPVQSLRGHDQYRNVVGVNANLAHPQTLSACRAQPTNFSLVEVRFAMTSTLPESIATGMPSDFALQ